MTIRDKIFLLVGSVNDNKWAILVQLCQIGAVLNRSRILLSVNYNRYKPSFHLACFSRAKRKKGEMPQGDLTRRGQG